MENPKQQLIERLKTANNVLVTVSTNPSVDQLSAAIGLTLMLNKLGKHATAVFSGQVPSTIEFLQPEKTLEKNTDSLRDFIIALDKSKADKLRYKVEDNFVRIFITPYRTSITEKDLDFSQGDFNVEVVVALGVHDQKDLDHAITSHGRILHDATTFSLTTDTPSTLGSVNWSDQQASSLCEMVASIANPLQDKLLDGQMATALLTGIIAETERFSNQKTSPVTMSLSAALMSAGANQQLVASKLEEPKEVPKEEEKPAPKHHKAAKKEDTEDKEKKDDNSGDGSLQISHDTSPPPDSLPAIEPEPIIDDLADDIDIDAEGRLKQADEVAPPEEPKPAEPAEPEAQAPSRGTLMYTPPVWDGKLTANTEPEHEQLDPATDPLGSTPHDEPLLKHKDSDAEDAPEDLFPLASTNAPEEPIFTEADAVPQGAEQTLTQLEEVVNSPHVASGAPAASAPAAPEPTVDGARDAVGDALASIDGMPEPIDSLNAQPLGPDLDHSTDTFTLPENLVPPVSTTDTTATTVENPTAPPPVPPPMMPDLSVPPGLLPDDDRPVPPAEPRQPSNNPFGLPPA